MPLSPIGAETRAKLNEALKGLATSVHDQQSWNTVVACTRQYVLRLCQRRLGAVAQDAEDVCQSVYASAFVDAGLPRFVESPDVFLAYLSTIANRKCIDLLRKIQRRREDLLDDALPERYLAMSTSQPDIGEIRSVEDLISHLAGAGLALSEVDARLLREVGEGIDPADIAAGLQLTKSAMAVRLHRLRIKMRKYISDI